MFERRHYRKLAHCLKRQNKTMRFAMVSEMAVMLQADNPNFQRAAFLDASGWTITGRRIK